MKILISMALLAMAVQSAYSACTALDNCDTCSNTGPLCTSCPVETIMSSDKKKCLACGTGCKTCSADDKNKVTCLTCKSAYYLKNGACTDCSEGCAECALDSDGTTEKCTACKEAYGTKTDEKTSAISCIACPSKCKTCSVQTDDSTKCSACYDYKGKNIQSNFLKTKDKTCGTCPSNCDSCSDNGEGTGICKSCFKGYNPLTDAQDSTKDGTSCLKCATDCKACSGVKLSNGEATCTECVADKGLYVSAGKCITCGVGAKSCTATGGIDSCKEEFRKDGSACTACPAKCKSCPKDSTTNTVSCATCDASYGPKPAKSKTCDACGIANCKTCNRQNTGTFKCTACVQGNALKSDTECVACSSCKAETDCSWDGPNSRVKCTKCPDNYVDPVGPDGQCLACSKVKDCLKCEFNDPATDDVKCTKCTSPKLPDLKEPNTQACIANPGADNACEQIDTTTAGKCADGKCKKGYRKDGTTSKICEKCDVDKCDNCDTDKTKCDKTGCQEGYLVEKLTGTPPSKADKSCVACDGPHGVGAAPNSKTFTDCATCKWAGSPIAFECLTCKTGKIFNSEKTKCLANPDPNGKCTQTSDTPGVKCVGKCPEYYRTDSDDKTCQKCVDTNCKKCDSETTGGASKCTSCNAKFALTVPAGGSCSGCPTNCKDCTYDTPSSKTKCKSNQCDDKFVLSPTGTCESCGDNCKTCTYDTANSKVACTACADNYGLKQDKTCAACPSSCKTCARDGSPTADDTLYCSACTDSNALNSDVCGACPSNCKECTDNKGTMECSKCNDKYALNSKKACAKCPSNCLKCSAGGSTVKCSECAVGYSLSGDSTSCTDCATAAFTGCANCTYTDSASGKANCTACAAGYTLEDGMTHLSCKDVSSLECGSGTIADAGPQCSACSSGFSLTKSMLCAKKCHACGDVNADVLVEKAKCKIPAAGANATADDAKPIECLSGICYAVYQDGKVAAGCLPKKDALGQCTGDRAAGETCVNTDSKTQCTRCCDTDLCNSFVTDLDGKPDSAVSTAANLILLMAASYMALRFN